MRGLGQTVPTCLTEGQAVFLGSCMAQMPPPGMSVDDHVQACNALMGFADLPYCPGTTRLPIPSCLSQDEVAGIDYCHHGDGSSPYWNALCWGAQKDPAWWQQYITTQPCPGVSSPLAAPNAMQQDSPEGGAVVPPPPAQKSNMMLYAMIGIGGVIVLGAGIYFARKKR
jgi:hypothetical protein